MPSVTEAYILRICIPAGSVVTNNGVLKTNYPLSGGPFDRDAAHGIE